MRGDGQDAALEDGLAVGVCFTVYPTHVAPYAFCGAFHHGVALALRGRNEHRGRLPVDKDERIATIDEDDLVGEVFNFHDGTACGSYDEACAQSAVAAATKLVARQITINTYSLCLYRQTDAE